MLWKQLNRDKHWKLAKATNVSILFLFMLQPDTCPRANNQEKKTEQKGIYITQLVFLHKQTDIFHPAFAKRLEFSQTG